MAEESDIEDDDSSSFDIGEVLNWLDTSENSGQQANIEGGEDDDSDESGPQLYGDLGDLVNSTQVDTVITEMGFDVDALDESESDLFAEEQENVTDGRPIEFGDGYSSIGVRVSDDGYKAILDCLTFGDVNQPPSVEELKEVMNSKMGITHGWQDDVIREGIAEAQQRAIWDGQTVIAEATMPEKAADGRLEYSIQTNTKNDPPLNGTELSVALKGDDITTALKIKGSPILVAPGKTIATVVTPQAGKPGVNVFGQEILSVGKLASRPIAGDGVRQEEDSYTAESLGYVCLIDNRLQILSPLWLDTDNCGARFLYFPQESANTVITTSNLMELLERANISFGIIETAVEKLCGNGGGSKRAAIVIARGHKAVVGRSAHFNPYFGPDIKEQDTEQGSIDYRNRNEFIPVSQGDLLGEYVPATKGVGGTTVFGEELPAADGASIQFVVGAGIRIELKNGESEKEEESSSNAEEESPLPNTLIADQRNLLYAEISGSVRHIEETIEVLPVVVIAGDVDLSVGHVSTKGDVKVSGAVQFGFTVTCGGSVEIAGGVENGVTIRAEGDVIVHQAIIGEKTRIISGGNVSARLVHNATVVAQGEVNIAHSLVNARISAGSTITVMPGSGRAGSIVGGESYAARFIEAKTLGSSGMEPTRVGCRPSPQSLAHLGVLRKQLASNGKIVAKCMRWMGISKFDKQQIDRAFQTVPSEKRETFAKALRDGVQAAARLSALPEEISKTTSEHQEIINKGQIRASEAFFAEVVIEFGIREKRLFDTDVGGRYVLTDDEVRWRPSL